MTDAILTGEGVTRRFGGLCAVNNVDFSVSRGEIFGLIGPNGAGKTTLFHLIAGKLPVSAGKIRFKGAEIQNLRACAICERGIARTFQIPSPFLNLTVLENVEVAALYGRKGRVYKGLPQAHAAEILEVVGLGQLAAVSPQTLSIGDLKRLEVARALATEPELLLLDEVMGGLNPGETLRTMEMIRQLRNRGLTIVLIEHVMRAVMGISDRIMVLHHGEKLAEGTPVDVAHDPRVIQAYLGKYAEQAQTAAGGR